MRFVRRLYRQLIEWCSGSNVPEVEVLLPDFIAIEPTIARDVSHHGVRIYSLCGCCGARLRSSATLCDECAQVKEARRRS